MGTDEGSCEGGGDLALRVACELNKARAHLKLQDEGACLAACAHAEALAPDSQAPVVRAQLLWLLSGASDQWEGPAVPRQKRKDRLVAARAILRERTQGDGGDRSRATLTLLKAVQGALKAA